MIEEREGMAQAEPENESSVIARAVRVLIAEDEGHLGTILKQFLTSRGYEVFVVRDGRTALDMLRSKDIDVALLDIVMPEIDGLEVLRQIRSESLPPEILIISGNGTTETALASLKLGAYDFVTKPYRMAEIEALVNRAWEKRILLRNNRLMRARSIRSLSKLNFITQYAPLRAVQSLLERVSKSSSPALITGEAGTGKTFCAHLMHRHSHIAAGPIVILDCATVAVRSGDDQDACAQLFGVGEVDVDGARSDSPGVIALAAGGTLLLENIDALPLKSQRALMSALACGTYSAMGGSRVCEVNARIVATTAMGVERLRESEAFNSELLHHLSAITLSLPPLRERAVDIPLLADHHLSVSGLSGGRYSLGTDAVCALEKYGWPGNVSELNNVLDRAMMITDGDIIETQSLMLTPAMTLAEMERRHIAAALQQNAWHQGKAALSLDISPKTLYRKIRLYGFTRPGERAVKEDGSNGQSVSNERFATAPVETESVQ